LSPSELSLRLVRFLADLTTLRYRLRRLKGDEIRSLFGEGANQYEESASLSLPSFPSLPDGTVALPSSFTPKEREAEQIFREGKKQILAELDQQKQDREGREGNEGREGREVHPTPLSDPMKELEMKKIEEEQCIIIIIYLISSFHFFLRCSLQHTHGRVEFSLTI
jgi:hypothetical protein